MFIADSFVSGVSIPTFAIPLIGLAFFVGFAAIPKIVDIILRYKRRQLQKNWYESLDAFVEHDLALRLPTDSEEDEKKHDRELSSEEEALRQWAIRQRRAVTCRTLDQEQVVALRKAHIIAPPQDWDDDKDFDESPSVALTDELYTFEPGFVQRTLCGLVLAFAALICSIASNPAIALSGFAAVALMEVMMITDLRVKLIPFETTAVFWVFALIFGLVSGPLIDFGYGLLAGFAILFVLMLADFLCRALGGTVGVGMGDLRLLPAIAIFSGLWGTVVGFIAASILSLFMALYVLIFKHGNRKSTIPYAPGLCLWCVVGLFMQVVACV